MSVLENLFQLVLDAADCGFDATQSNEMHCNVKKTEEAGNLKFISIHYVKPRLLDFLDSFFQT